MSLLDKRFCVYLHKRKDNGEVFYVGSGNAKRPYVLAKGQRGSAWDEVRDQTDVDVEVLLTDLTKYDATLKEAEIYKELREKFVLANKATPSNARTLTREMFPELSYSAEYKSGLLRNGRGVCNVPNRGCWSLTYKQKGYQAHRVIWALVYGICPADKLVDHIDGNPLNNKIENLRLVNPDTNQKNRKPETEYPTGVQNRKDWCIVTDHNRKNYTVSKKYFGDKALLACCEFRRRLFNKGMFPGYTERHMNLLGEYLPEISDEELLEIINFTKKLSARNKSGIVGVCRTAKGSGAWIYNLRGNNERFSVIEHGEEKAKLLALEAKLFYENILPGKPLNLARASCVFPLMTDKLSFQETGLSGVVIIQRFGEDPHKRRTIQATCYSYHDMIKSIRDLKIRLKEYK